ncbi:uncharacterized protein CLAFUR5_11866 [Fulvia fulva]|uniref:Uncharacterized protein n=1 Tax=Passalora fulva TaxID=5499 RepID=A0A9Q8PHL1_PASFU|nr:uncharacterized protein CLAFUR5_11866 [Fulvia fulva]KAK4627610.1 hypothetical protein CLAFUR0_05031 [Fulvia fulva]UJO22579.1 hypothetical protein CLAFUR5_11866 [Fulvia fulva]
MEGINPQRMAMIANTPAPAVRPAITDATGPTGTQSNNIPLGTRRHGLRFDDATQFPAQDSRPSAAAVGPPENTMGDAQASPATKAPYNGMMSGMDDDDQNDSDDQDETTFILDRSTAQHAEMGPSWSNHGPAPSDFYRPSWGNHDPAPSGYYQHPEPFSGFGTQDLWHLPAADRRFVMKDHHVRSPIRLFHSACKRIVKNWDCAPLNCLPLELRRTTPYSLALFLRLSELSRAIISDCRVIKDLLFSQVASRVSRLPLPAGDSPGLRIVQSPGQEHAEEWILENVEGLMLDDLRVIFSQLRHSSATRTPIALNASDSVRLEIQAAINREEMKKDRKERKKASRSARRQQQNEELKAAGRVPNKRERQLLAQQQRVVAQQQKEPEEAAHREAAQGDETAELDPHRYPLRSREADVLTQQLNSLGVDSLSTTEAYRKDRHKRLKANFQRGLPSERLQGAFMPSLHLMAEERKERAAIDGMSRLGLSFQQPLPSLAFNQLTGGSDNTEGCVSLPRHGSVPSAQDNMSKLGLSSQRPFSSLVSNQLTGVDEGGVSLLGQGSMPSAQDNILNVGMHGYPDTASLYGRSEARRPRLLGGTRCAECFHLRRECTHLELSTDGGNKGQRKPRWDRNDRRNRDEGRGGRVEHAGPRHG